jgi:hypothetical protein
MPTTIVNTAFNRSESKRLEVPELVLKPGFVAIPARLSFGNGAW